MSARIFGRYGRTKGIDLRIDDKATIGRDPENEVCVAASEVSKDHATLLYDRDRGGYLLTDLGSRNGTLLDGAPLRGPELLQGLHVITLAESIDLIFHGDPPEPGVQEASAAAPAAEGASATAPAAEGASATAPVSEPVSAPEPAPAPEPARPSPEAVAPQRFALVIEAVGEDQGTHLLAEGENGVGRGAELTVKLGAGEVSRNHAVITVQDGVVTLRDNGSANGTFLNGVAVSSNVRAEEGAVLRFGSLEATLRRVGEP